MGKIGETEYDICQNIDEVEELIKDQDGSEI